MTSPLQTISLSDQERTTIYRTYTRDSFAVIHQQKERVSPSGAGPFNDLAPRQMTAIKTRNGLQKVTYCYRTTSLIITIYFNRIEKE